ncbi:DUF1827 family protein [Xylocopilactobacillus apicola]|uniref:DUF1827 family protein n=1 Tax=Xylocopilactobacillus apicola TaxID=2932184 RepID=A0AAU9DBF3_9LACO|nr:DUF1827 family protein [Xylocopilactobacillus apicola]BDR58855.1 hypothetical protein XA3_12960 [Xylocopilactobacillus apicola]
MKLVNTTNSYSSLVENQLLNTDASLIKVYSLGRTTVVYTRRPHTIEIVLENKHRGIQEPEIKKVVEELLGKNERNTYSLIKNKGLVEISAEL